MMVRPFWKSLQQYAFAAGMVLVACFGWQFVVSLSSVIFLGGDESLSSARLNLQGILATSNTRGEWRIKRAAVWKVRKLLTNAFSLHEFEPRQQESSSFGSAKYGSSFLSKQRIQHEGDQTMLNFVLHGHQEEQVGGFLWTWKRIVSREMFNVEGIWFPTRFLVFQAAQVLIAIFLTFMGFRLVDLAVQKAAEEQKAVNPDWPLWAQK